MRPPLSPPALDELLGAARRRQRLRRALVVLVLATAAVVAAAASGQTQSCWSNGILADRCFALDASVRPWGPDGGHVDQVAVGAVRGGELFSKRYAGGNPTSGSQPIGHTPGEDNVGTYALQNAYAGLCPGLIDLRPGRTAPSAEEIWDLVVTVPRYSAIYEQCYWQWQPGGTAERAIIVTAENWSQYAGRFSVPGGACKLGPHSVAELGGWRRHFDVRWLPDSRPWCDWTPPKAGDRVEVQAFPAWLPGTVSRVAGTEVTIRLDAGGTRREQLADEPGRWRRVGEQPQPSPTPGPTPGPTPEPTPPDEERCEPVEPELCPCADNTAAARGLLEQVAAWPRRDDGTLRARFAKPTWWLVANAARVLDELRSGEGEFCPCFRSTGQTEYLLCEIEGHEEP